MTNNHRSATVSPSSENSPSQDMQSEEGSYPHPGGGGFNQYSSQDSLPDSPYSSQSLDSQPAPGQGKRHIVLKNMKKVLFGEIILKFSATDSVKLAKIDLF